MYRVFKGGSFSITGGPSQDPTERYAGFDGLDPDFVSRLQDTLDTLTDMGYEPEVYETVRSEARGEYLKEKGVSQLGAKSYHVTGLAADIIDGRDHPDRSGFKVGWGSWEEANGASATDGDKSATTMAQDFFDQLAGVATQNGLTAGHYWGWQDSPHIELS